MQPLKLRGPPEVSPCLRLAWSRGLCLMKHGGCMHTVSGIAVGHAAAQIAVATNGLSVLCMGLVREPRSLKRMGCMRAVSSTAMSSSAGNGRTFLKSTLDTRAHASTTSGSSSSLLPCRRIAKLQLVRVKQHAFRNACVRLRLAWPASSCSYTLHSSWPRD